MDNRIPFCTCEQKASTCVRTYRDYDGRSVSEMTLPICMHCNRPITIWPSQTIEVKKEADGDERR